MSKSAFGGSAAPVSLLDLDEPVDKMRWFLLVSLAFTAALVPVSAQTPALIGSGYGSPAPMIVAPGQVMEVHVSGAHTILPLSSPSISASGTPWPTSLGGFSVTVRQGQRSFAAPLLSVVQTSSCTSVDQPPPQCILTKLTIQIPFELTAISFVVQLPAELSAELSVSDNGVESAHYPIVPLIDNIHLLTECDVQHVLSLLPSPCTAIVTHADGRMVSNGSPAQPGETVVMYGYGFGATYPTVSDGVTTPTRAPAVLNEIKVQFDFRPNAGASIPYAPAITGRPLFVGLTPGQVGLYQVNVKIPEAVPSLPRCTMVFSCLGSLLGCVTQSNLTIDVSGMSSLDGAAICVEPGGPAADPVQH